MNRHKGITNSILDLIGQTPMVRLAKITKNFLGTYYAKVEAFNPGHSAKDRIALHIIESAEKKGILKKGDTIVETTSGNTGFSLAMISVIKGYKCILAVSDKSSQDKIDMLKSMGAEVHVCPANVPADDARSYYEVAKRLHKENPGSIYINQYFNELNIEAHYKSTGPEIWKQTKGKVTHVVIASGTGGTISGTGKYLKEKNPKIKVLGVDAIGSVLKKYHETGEFDENEISPYKIEGLGKNLIPTATDFDVIDIYEKVSDKDAALTARKLVKTEGLFCGYTSGAVLQATEQYNEKGYFDKDSVVVLLLPDHGSRYMNKIYSDTWMKEQGFLECNSFVEV
ncbi:pyridoxal-phosphate dependent enzyme [Tenacibaculum finnmarkense genomovar finnmarkense]|uniref:Pyridoxal-phosphate dependent enzyme n=1 Tax=Tenacibaculum finnmarkense genomovar finnmarkense TaxID=1458503 RepID=A0AAP1WFX8_9FLAO|nr:pyridoxal-phosphate dependent enzyme [Tenacibaculum finnmarkense]MBE7652381.1 pyridoxal-phosphate dependent enzyme [Tenacibaculum finnmarkense genomovar finnmarkense]MBE7660629.1 pyridoxal-phosphate dependent enzyme [Tenacibaculum finnmarkense genomovar finnmarkense]MBE7694809.1 pyridoxal-phosphate dependent enzyme [Tenacibaculum finnmarkense genomovar finnmarkense]MCD8403595.1 pyridoxal-phosphate dependent enzyme [Tenacibaculum finnmarkense genomovar finnmarkense]MCD8413374.1 pyridoxal-pho